MCRSSKYLCRELTRLLSTDHTRYMCLNMFCTTCDYLRHISSPLPNVNPAGVPQHCERCYSSTTAHAIQPHSSGVTTGIQVFIPCSSLLPLCPQLQPPQRLRATFAPSHSPPRMGLRSFFPFNTLVLDVHRLLRQSSLMTGRDTFRTGMQFEVVEDSAPWGLPLDEVTLAQRFKTAGYATHMVSCNAGHGRPCLRPGLLPTYVLGLSSI